MYTHPLFISTFSLVSLARICIYCDFASIGHTYFPFYTAQFSRAYALIFQNYHGLDDEKSFGIFNLKFKGKWNGMNEKY